MSCTLKRLLEEFVLLARSCCSHSSRVGAGGTAVEFARKHVCIDSAMNLVFFDLFLMRFSVVKGSSPHTTQIYSYLSAVSAGQRIRPTISVRVLAAECYGHGAAHALLLYASTAPKDPLPMDLRPTAKKKSSLFSTNRTFCRLRNASLIASVGSCC